jgi:U4/U6.U5 tri-snRNP component SNU23
MSSSINKNVNVERRTWDKETYEARARSRAAAEATAEAGSNLSHAQHHANDISGGGSGVGDEIKNQIDPSVEKEEFLPAQQGRAGPMGSKRAFLKARSQKVDLESKLGTSEIIDPSAASATKSNLLSDNDALKPSSGVTKCSDGVGWHCRVCDCFLKDSLTYLDHINGRKHQRYLGYSMRVEKSTTEEVSGVLKGLAEKKREREGNNLMAGGVKNNTIDFEDVVRKKDEEALKRKAERARKREERKRRERGEMQELVTQDRNDDVEENLAGGEEEDNEEEEVEEEGMHPDLAAMMGFSGFGGSRK